MQHNRTIDAKLGGGSHHVSITATTVAFALSRGMTMAEIETVTGLEGAELGNPDARPPAEIAHKLWRALAAAEPDQPLGIEASRGASLSALGGMMHGMQYASTFREAIEFFIRHRVVLGDRLEIELVETEDEALLIAQHPADTIDGGYVSEVGAGLMVRLVREVLVLRAKPLRVELLTKQLGPMESYRDFFRCDVHFEAGRAALVYHRDLLSQRVGYADPTLFAFVERHFELIRAQIAALREPTGLALLRSAIAAAAASADYRASSIARRAGLSLRTAQRQAAAQGSSLQTMIDEARRANAVAFLGDESMTIARAAAMLGFSDDRAFRRAFKRWTGLTPSDYRKDRLAKS